VLLGLGEPSLSGLDGSLHAGLELSQEDAVEAAVDR
jgi:hypothetical protein